MERQLKREILQNQEAMVINEKPKINVLASVDIDPTVSVGRIADDLKTSRESVEVSKTHTIRSYKYNLHQALHEAGFERKDQYCKWLIH